MISTILFAWMLGSNACPGGRVEVVQAGADYRVRQVRSGEDIRVVEVTTPPYRCGQWHFVTQNADFTVQVVLINEDFTFRQVSRYPGRTRGFDG